MKKTELIKLKKILQQEIGRRTRIKELLLNDLVQEFIFLNKLNIQDLPIDDKWLILEEILKEFEISESNGILVCIGCFVTACSVCYQETDYYEKEVPFDSQYIKYQKFKDIETNKIYKAYCNSYVEEKYEESKHFIYPNITGMTVSEFCHNKYGRLTSELKEKYIILNPYNSSKNNNGFLEVRKDFFKAAIEKGQPKAKQLVLSKYPQMNKY